jgi:hypothetical protein
MKAIHYALALVAFGAATYTSQAQHQIDTPHLPPNINPSGISINLPPSTNPPLAEIQTGNIGGGIRDVDQTPNVQLPDSAQWLQQQSDSLLDIMGCYLEPPSLSNEVSAEKKSGDDPKSLIEQRIKFLKTVAQHNTASHCK